jgi:meso-butanediol dehydrogenase / (S,S)-butanediol dehydrogenase / diacetyl reductase
LHRPLPHRHCIDKLKVDGFANLLAIPLVIAPDSRLRRLSNAQEDGMTGRLAGKVAVITGAGGGIGRAVARRFVAEGARIIVSDISGAEEQTAAELGDAALAFNLDVQDRDAVFRMTETCVKHFGRIDIACNNAGGGAPQTPVHEIPADGWDRTFAINARGYLYVMQSAIPHMLEQGGGSIVNMCSLTAHRATPGSGAYLASKGAILSLTRAVALEYAANNIRCNSISPGAVATAMVERQTDEMKALIYSRIPMKRMGRPDEVAALAVFLASDEAPYLSGQDIIIDGARSAG